MKRTDRISPVVWAFGIIVIAATIFFVWLGHPRRVPANGGTPAPTRDETGALPAPVSSSLPNRQHSLPFRSIRIVVTDSRGMPLANSRLQVLSIVQDGATTPRSSSSLTTDANGSATVGYPQQNLNSLDINASHENYSGRKMLWNLESGDVIPASYTLKLTAEATIGATVVDTDNNPVPGATVWLHRFWSGGDVRPDKKGEQADFPSQKQTTGPDGHWHATGLPAELLDRINFEITHSNFLGTNLTAGANPAIEKQLRNETLKIVLPTGTGAHGIVIDENNRPLAGATVWAGRKYTRERQETKTDSEGRFAFPHINGGNVPFAVNASGHQPATQTVAINSSTPDIVFQLNVGRVVRAVVQDESGSPLVDVRVSLESARWLLNSDGFDFSSLTDVEGKFSWDSAPAEPQHFYFSREGYEEKHNVSLAPDEDNLVTLRAPRLLKGLVLDSNTGQPIPQFTIRTGQRSSPDQPNLYGSGRNRDFNYSDGRFSVRLDDADENAVQVWNDDHSIKTESIPEAENGVVELTIRLDPADALKGIVTMADGTPVPGANIIAIKGESGAMIQIQKNRFQSYDERTQVAVTDQQGAFSVKRPPEHGTVMAVADAGFASASIDDVRVSHLIVLQAFGRIEGTLRIAGAPAVGQSLLFTLPNSGITPDSQNYKTTTDDQGHFTIEKIPPGEGSIVRLISTTPNSWTYSHNTPVTVQAGQTTQVTLGDSGAVLRGTVSYQSPPSNGASLNISGRVFNAVPQAPVFSSSTEGEAYLRSPEWQAQIKRMRNYFFTVNPDGSFQVDSIEPGSYTIDVAARTDGDFFMSPGVAQGIIQFTVPDNADPMNPIAVGEIVLRPSK
jgi:hypothetical protein